MSTRDERSKQPWQIHPVKILCCAHQDDETFRSELEKHFTASKNLGFIASWRNVPGAYQEHEIEIFFSSVDFIFFMISPSSIGDIFCQNLMRRALEKSDAGEARLIPIWTRYINYIGTGLEKFQALPRGNKPLKAYTDRDKIYAEIVQEMQNVISEIQSETSQEIAGLVKSQQDIPSAMPPEDVFRAMHSAYEYTQRGDFFLHLGRYAQAWSAYEEALRLEPGFGSAHRGKGRVYEALALYQYKLMKQFVAQSLEIGELLDTYEILHQQAAQSFENARSLHKEKEDLEE